MKTQRILICKGNQGQQLIQQNILQIRLYQIEKINKQHILNYYIKTSKYPTDIKPINLVTKLKNHYIDALLLHNQQLISYQNEHIQQITSSKIQLPLQLQLVYPENQFKIQSGTEVDIKYFNVLKKIGQGTFAEIFLAEQKYNRALVTLKRINKTQQLQKGSKQMLLNQFTALKYRHQHKVNLMYMFQTDQFIYYVMDYCVYGDLYTLIYSQKQIPECDQCDRLDKKQIYSIWMQVAFMIVHMHQKGFIYRDLKPQNILINQLGFIKLCDFGYCTKYEKEQTFKQICGTLQYIPPELIFGQAYDKTIDIYALGILLYELIQNKTPFEGITMENMKQKKIQTITFDKRIFSPLEISLIQSLTHKDSQQRLGCQNSMIIFKHPFFDSAQVVSIIKQIVKRKPDYNFLFKLKNTSPKQLQRKKALQGQHRKFFQSSYNYLTPGEQIQEKIGPKFNSSF